MQTNLQSLLEAVRVLIEVSKNEWTWQDEFAVYNHEDLTSLYVARMDLRDAVHVVEQLYEELEKSNATE